jgi:hypothetical protein
MNALEVDILCFEAAWKCTPANRDAISYAQFLKQIQFLRQKKRANPNVGMLLVLTKLFVRDCLKAHKFEAAVEAVRIWAGADEPGSFNEVVPKFSALIKLCDTDELIEELCRNLRECFYCDSFSDLFSEPTDGGIGYPAALAKILLQSYVAIVDSQDFVRADGA